MSIAKIKKLTEALKNMEGEMPWVDEEIIDLLVAIGDYILEKGIPRHKGTQPRSGFIPWEKFLEQVGIISKSRLNWYCNHHEEFSNDCAVNIHGKWHIHKDNAEHFFSKIPIYNNRLEYLYKIEQKLLSRNKDNLIEEG